MRDNIFAHLLPATSVCKNHFESVLELRQLDPDHASKKLVSDRQADVYKLMGDGNNLRGLRLHRFYITEGKSEKMFEEIVLMQVVVTLVADFKEIPYLF